MVLATLRVNPKGCVGVVLLFKPGRARVISCSFRCIFRHGEVWTRLKSSNWCYNGVMNFFPIALKERIPSCILMETVNLVCLKWAWAEWTSWESGDWGAWQRNRKSERGTWQTVSRAMEHDVPLMQAPHPPTFYSATIVGRNTRIDQISMSQNFQLNLSSTCKV